MSHQERRVFLVAKGQSHPRAFSAEARLTNKGRKQAKKAGQTLAQIVGEHTVVISTPESDGQETARLVSSVLAAQKVDTDVRSSPGLLASLLSDDEDLPLVGQALRATVMDTLSTGQPGEAIITVLAPELIEPGLGWLGRTVVRPGAVYELHPDGGLEFIPPTEKSQKAK